MRAAALNTGADATRLLGRFPMSTGTNKHRPLPRAPIRFDDITHAAAIRDEVRDKADSKDKPEPKAAKIKTAKTAKATKTTKATKEHQRTRRVDEGRRSKGLPATRVEKALEAMRGVLSQVEHDIGTAISLLSVISPAKDAPADALEIGDAFDIHDRQAVRVKIQDLRKQRNVLRKQLEERETLYGRELYSIRERLKRRAHILKVFEGETQFLSRNADLAHFFMEKQSAMRTVVQDTEKRIFETSIDAIGKHIADKQKAVAQIRNASHNARSDQDDIEQNDDHHDRDDDDHDDDHHDDDDHDHDDDHDDDDHGQDSSSSAYSESES